MIDILLKVLMIASGTALYACGELYKKELKYIMGIPIAVFAWFLLQTLLPLFCVLTYFIATEFGYGDNNPLTKLLGKRGAITFCGLAVGLASFPIIGYWCLLQAIISGGAWYYMAILDDADKLKEPWIGILRGLTGTILLLGA